MGQGVDLEDERFKVRTWGALKYPCNQGTKRTDSSLRSENGQMAGEWYLTHLGDLRSTASLWSQEGAAT